MIELITATVILILLSGIWSGTETALFSVDLNKAKLLYAEGKCTRLFLTMIENKESFVSTLVFLNNIVNIAGSMFVGGMALKEFGEGTANIVFSFSLTLLIIVFAEIIPKTIGGRKSQGIVGFMAKPLNVAQFILNPVVILVMMFTNMLLKLMFGEFKEEAISENEIGYLVSEAAKDMNSEIRENEAKIIKRVFSLYDLKAKDIMTPRVLISHIKGGDTLEQAADAIKASQHSRIVVIDEVVDNVIGMAHKEHLLIDITEGRQKQTIIDLGIDTVKHVSETISAEALMRIFLSEKKHLAIVQDDHGGVSGVVTLEDVLEILVGEIVDETDQAEDLRKVAIEIKRNKLKT